MALESWTRKRDLDLGLRVNNGGSGGFRPWLLWICCFSVLGVFWDLRVFEVGVAGVVGVVVVVVVVFVVVVVVEVRGLG